MTFILTILFSPEYSVYPTKQIVFGELSVTLLLVFLENIEFLRVVVESHLKHFVSVSVRDLH